MLKAESLTNDPSCRSLTRPYLPAADRRSAPAGRRKRGYHCGLRGDQSGGLWAARLRHPFVQNHLGAGIAFHRHIDHPLRSFRTHERRLGVGERAGEIRPGDPRAREEVGKVAFSEQLSAFSKSKGWTIVSWSAEGSFSGRF